MKQTKKNRQENWKNRFEKWGTERIKAKLMATLEIKLRFCRYDCSRTEQIAHFFTKFKFTQYSGLYFDVVLRLNGNNKQQIFTCASIVI